MEFKKKVRQEPIRIIFDLETLDTQPTGVIVSVGIVPFRLTDQNTFMELVDKGVNILLERQPQIDVGCTVSEDTLKWWGTQGDAAREVLEGGERYDPALINELIFEGIGKIPPKTKWYARGQHFDFPMMNHLCFKLGIREPWGYQDPRDLRTWFDFYPMYERDLWKEKVPEFIPHNSLHDSALEALHAQQCYRLQLEADKVTA